MWIRPNKPELDAIKTPTAIDIAWAAGIYEGEGTCRLCGNSSTGADLIAMALLKLYEEERELRSSPTAKARRAQRAGYYRSKASDPAWVKAKNEKARKGWQIRKEQRQAKPSNLLAIA